MHPASRVLVISRSAQQERSIQRDGLLVVLTQIANAVMCSGAAVLWWTWTPGPSRWLVAVPVVAVACSCYVARAQLRWRRINRDMFHLQVALTDAGVTYASAAGTYSAPWSAVRQVRLRTHRARSPYVVIDVDGWGGPLSECGGTDRLALTLTGTGLRPREVSRAVHQLSGGQVTTRN
ncbi:MULTISPECIES: PH domain-containing protein [unclassified Saccharopolyspora]|uniref:PH domain-containing protein n=1 Tax=unclassified Saccharopolyspora TaxID=2646250 RepID=UPI001CD61C75|nr:MULTISPECIES: PH domain-containing protein [unclassified Saccharopolyspora]MCA1189316.1 PH domain-containing protein [Saccharopolyspora sp. 6T]MCA1195294.1 PH domain-containing protein [Saccharopolyspora sp. 6V]MCA1229120.1 PH domain-containing protein [Saccharopolyspora sp. 6M]MCA1283014.1 PH domain-containing protein [Saccharopolyspora sp. 7B]